MVDGLPPPARSNPGLYGKVGFTAFGPTSGPVAPAGSADLVLFLRNLHNWMAAGLAEKAFRDAFAALKPGGVLGVEEHRADPARRPGRHGGQRLCPPGLCDPARPGGRLHARRGQRDQRQSEGRSRPYSTSGSAR